MGWWFRVLGEGVGVVVEGVGVLGEGVVGEGDLDV
jgi:hypothetical protein